MSIGVQTDPRKRVTLVILKTVLGLSYKIVCRLKQVANLMYLVMVAGSTHAKQLITM